MGSLDSQCDTGTDKPIANCVAAQPYGYLTQLIVVLKVCQANPCCLCSYICFVARIESYTYLCTFQQPQNLLTVICKRIREDACVACTRTVSWLQQQQQQQACSTTAATWAGSRAN
jgi:hypothetical protein